MIRDNLYGVSAILLEGSGPRLVRKSSYDDSGAREGKTVP